MPRAPGTDHRVLGTDQRAYIGLRVTVAFPGMADEDTSLVGREEELSRLRGLVASPYTESRVLLLLGDPGMGKTVLLAEAARGARSAGMRVLAAAGRESEQNLAFAGLHQLLRPVLDRVDSLPAVQAEALRGAFAISEDPVPPDALLTGIAVLTLLSGLSDDGPLLVVTDDAQWLDPPRSTRSPSPPGGWNRNGSSCSWRARGNEPPAPVWTGTSRAAAAGAAEHAGSRAAPRRAAATATRPGP